MIAAIDPDTSGQIGLVIAFAAFVAVLVDITLLRRRADANEVDRRPVFALGVCLASSDMRWDYWRNVGGDHRRRHEWAEAVVAYTKANEYAPEGEDRNRQLDEVTEQLRRERAREGR